MNGGHRIIELRADEAGADVPEGASADGTGIAGDAPDERWEDDRWDIDAEAAQADARAPLRTALAVVAILVVLGWTGGMLWLAGPALTRPVDPIELAQFIATLCVPPILIGLIWLIGLRTSRAEARRFGATARAMRAESAALEHSVAALGRRLEENRQLLAEQTAALLAMGDGAAERLQAIGNGMADQAKAIDRSSRTIVESTEDADRRLGVMLTSLPRAREEVQTMALRIEATGLSAGEQAAALAAHLASLTERGREADAVTGAAAQKLAAHIARMEATSETAGARLETVTGEMSASVDALLDRTAQAVEEARKSIGAQGDAMLAMLASNHASIAAAGEEGASALAERVAAIDAAIERLSVALAEQQEKGDTLVASLATGTDDADRQFAVMHARGMERSQELAASISALTETAEAMRGAMVSGQDMARQVIGTAEELLTALDASAREIDETLPDALARLDARIGASRAVVSAAKPELLALVTAAESTHDAIEAIAGVVREQRDTLDTVSASLLDTLDAGKQRIGDVRGTVDAATGEAQRFADEAAPQLVEALLRIRDTAAQVRDQARATLATVIPDAARRLEEEGGAALTRAVDATVASRLAELTMAADAAVAAASNASDRLGVHLDRIAAATAEVEARIEDDRTVRESADSDNFARRVSLIIESLNSNAIDIAKIFGQEVTDSAWSAYLKGDRGVFTRRAVRLIDSGEAREIAAAYDRDPEFRDQVNRYIHDFEAMLRQVLALRDGAPMGVTLLSSDMGKLYVALSQSIERLRG